MNRFPRTALPGVIALLLALTPLTLLAQKADRTRPGPEARRRNPDRPRRGDRESANQPDRRKRQPSRQDGVRTLVLQFENIPADSFIETLDQLAENDRVDDAFEEIAVAVNRPANAVVILAPGPIADMLEKIAEKLDQPSEFHEKRAAGQRQPHPGSMHRGPGQGKRGQMGMMCPMCRKRMEGMQKRGPMESSGRCPRSRPRRENSEKGSRPCDGDSDPDRQAGEGWQGRDLPLRGYPVWPENEECRREGRRGKWHEEGENRKEGRRDPERQHREGRDSDDPHRDEHRRDRHGKERRPHGPGLGRILNPGWHRQLDLTEWQVDRIEKVLESTRDQVTHLRKRAARARKDTEDREQLDRNVRRRFNEIHLAALQSIRSVLNEQQRKTLSRLMDDEKDPDDEEDPHHDKRDRPRGRESLR